MTDLVGKQHTLGQRIGRIVVNIKKKGKSNISLGLMQSCLSHIQDLWDKFQIGDEALRAAAEIDSKIQESAYIKDDEFEIVELAYLEQAAWLRDMIAELTVATPSGSSNNSNATDSETVTQRSRAVLPKMALPTFDGQYKNWPSFRDLFSSLIIKDKSLSPVERLHYLKTCMKGSASSLLKNVRTTADNFQVAWEKLEDRYENRRLLVQSQIRLLTNIAPVRKESSVDIQRLFDETFDAVDALANLNRPVTNAVDWIVELTVERLDRQSRREWEDLVKLSKELPTLDQLKSFLIGRIQTCEALQPSPSEVTSTARPSVNKGFKVHQVSKSNFSVGTCGLCNEPHFVQRCAQFRDKTPAERRVTVRELHLCFNCLGNHSVQECGSSKRYRIQRPTRSIEYPGSEVSLISEALAQRLGLRRSHARIPLSGVGHGRTQFTRGKTSLQVTSHHNPDVQFRIPAYILSELSTYQPRNLPSSFSWPHIQGLTLADPCYHGADPIDILLGAESGGASVINAEGKISRTTIPVHHCAVDQELMSALTRFWEQEEVEVPIPDIEEDHKVEEHFSSTYTRQSDGRFIVRLPFKVTPDLGISRNTAVRTLDNMTTRFKRSSEFRSAYYEFPITEYSARAVRPLNSG